MTTIAEQVTDVKFAAASRLPAEVVAVFASDQAALAAGGIPVGAVAAGDTLDAFTLPDATGQARTLDELTSEGPAVIVFYRGGWCPYCNLTLRSYERDPYHSSPPIRRVSSRSRPRLRTRRSAPRNGPS